MSDPIRLDRTLPRGVSMNKDKKPATDWDLIEVDYGAGLKPLRQISEEYDVSHVAIGNRARKGGWTRYLAAKIKAKAEA